MKTLKRVNAGEQAGCWSLQNTMTALVNGRLEWSLCSTENRSGAFSIWSNGSWCKLFDRNKSWSASK